MLNMHIVTSLLRKWRKQSTQQWLDDNTSTCLSSLEKKHLPAKLLAKCLTESQNDKLRDIKVNVDVVSFCINGYQFNVQCKPEVVHLTKGGILVRSWSGKISAIVFSDSGYSYGIVRFSLLECSNKCDQVVKIIQRAIQKRNVFGVNVLQLEAT